MIQTRQFDEAFEHLTFLHDNYPQVPGLEDTLDRLLYGEALALYSVQEYERALLLLDEIHQRKADQRGVINGLRRVLDSMLTARVAAGDYRDARRTYDVARSGTVHRLRRFWPVGNNDLRPTRRPRSTKLDRCWNKAEIANRCSRCARCGRSGRRPPGPTNCCARRHAATRW